MNKYVKLIFGIAISCVFLYLIFRKTDLQQIFSLILAAKWGFVLLSLVLTVVSLYIRSYRWQVLLKEHHVIPRRSCMESICIGLTTNNLLPFRLGDLTQAYVLAKRNSLSKSLVLSTVVVERLCDLVFPLVVITASSVVILAPGSNLVFAFLVVIPIGLLFLFIAKGQVKNIVSFIFSKTQYSERIVRAVDNFYAGFKVFRTWQNSLLVTFYTLVLWTCYSLMSYCILLAVRIDLSLLKVIWVQAVTAMSVVIPSSPGYIGTWEFFAQSALQVLGVNKELGLTFAILSHATQYIVQNVMGIYMIAKTGLSFAEIGNTRNNAEDNMTGGNGL
ncbi:MAG: lysylphosphatidylglycerol synthase transmembrane domain-containing protein [Elusimicrobiota bacterium]